MPHRFSRLDAIYRSFLITKYFVQGWGNPNHLIRLIKFRKFLSENSICFKLVPEFYPINVTNDFIQDKVRIIEGVFTSPFDLYLPDLLPDESKNAYFQMILPIKWKSNMYRPVCLHMAGTGDHYFWRRRELIAKPLLNEHGIASIILENPFYGLRKPQAQVRSNLHYVSDIFVMGGCLMMEALALFHWCKRNGFGPIGVTGISMGGHMASLAAACWPYPLVLVPCLSWSTASPVFTRGVMSGAIDWNLLNAQYEDNEIYKTEIAPLMRNISYDPFISSGFYEKYEEIPEVDNGRISKWNKSFRRQKQQAQIALDGLMFDSDHKFKRLNLIKFKDFIETQPIIYNQLNRMIKSSQQHSEEENTKSETSHKVIEFMKLLMDEFTHLSNFPVPYDTSLVISISALNDAYVPRTGVIPLTYIWPGIKVKYLNAGHITAFLFHQKAFRDAIVEGFQRYQKKYM